MVLQTKTKTKQIRVGAIKIKIKIFKTSFFNLKAILDIIFLFIYFSKPSVGAGSWCAINEWFYLCIPPTSLVMLVI